ncbi:hypothetical protein QEH59_06995 [Coraliomargarita sp. SDUM461004]|uniref:Type 4 fimbrial biogenesis protein PilX N-terminal domain-containing protein n=1 Tax=Thalassobacterium sedimentorum TaxID=3041258 RepID=A0ABU1AHT0_9BACT|nr:hypothetical protein [Coraliomargarita sp. SDUM461004]MDQ8194164.1 hypothetical protein [Coraliomargarita sp. SDUM461004]
MLAKYDEETLGKQGFALVISLLLMSFVLILLLTLSVQVQVETRLSSSDQQLLRARQNALLGLYVALGELQSLSGVDQRVTARAALDDSDASTALVEGIEHPNWIGVWDASVDVNFLNSLPASTDAYYDYSNRADQRFLGWLVSGENPDPRTGISGDNAVTIFGANFTGIAQSHEVIVESLEIEGRNGLTGRTAWWLSDEGIKADASLYDPARDSGATEARQRASFMVSQRNAIEAMGTAGDIFNNFGNVGPDIECLRHINELSLVDELSGSSEDIQNALDLLAHDMTMESHGLLTDTLRGGFKTDLSVLLREADSTNFDPSIYEIASYSRGDGRHALAEYPTGSSSHPTPNAPTWEQLIDYYQLGDRISDSVELRGHSADGSGIFPVITRYVLNLQPLFERNSGGDRFLLFPAPIVVLWNPYSVPVQIPSNAYVDLLIKDEGFFLGSLWRKGLKSSGSIAGVLDELLGPNPIINDMGVSLDQQVGGGDLMELPGLTRLVDPLDSNEGYTGYSFRLPSVEMAPGQVLAFGIHNDEEAYDGRNELELGAFPIDPKAAKFDTGLRASSTWTQVVDEASAKPYLASGNDPSDAYDYFEAGSFQINMDLGKNDSAKRNPFRVAVGLRLNSDPSDLYDQDDYVSLSYDIIASNPNQNRYDGPSSIQRHDIFTIGGTGIDDVSYMFPNAFSVDVVLGSGFEYVDNVMQSSNAGFFIRNRWNVGQNFRAPFSGPSSIDPATGGNSSFGAIGSYRHYDLAGSIDMHVPEISLTFSGEGAFFGSGIDVTGQSSLSYFDVPQRSVGVLSLGALQHLPVAEYSSSHSYGISNGIANPRVADTGSLYPSASSFSDTRGGELLPLDQSFLLNQSVWDAYYFSGHTRELVAADLVTSEGPLYNSRYRYSSEATGTGLNHPRFAAQNFFVNGAFNINSTSVEAWKAILSGANGLSFNPVTGSHSGSLTFPFSRMAQPIAGASDEWKGYRELSSGEIDRLAETIVEQVKERGPFLSLSDFVNRRLVGGNVEAGLRSALEVAIDKAGINTVLESTSGSFSLSDVPTSIRPGSDFIEDVSEGSFYEGIAGWLTQGDILQQIAPFISPRSDTFTIRGYGSAIDPTTNEVDSEVICEAVVQRKPQYVDDSDNPEDRLLSFNSVNGEYQRNSLDPINERFGRKYEIISFRWVQP